MSTNKKRRKIKTFYLPWKSSKYPGSYPKHFERELPGILETDNFIHLFAGMCETGFRVDIKSEVKPAILSDVHKLPFGDNTFFGGMADPPYTKEFAKRLYDLDYPKFYTWTEELTRVVKPGGRIGVMQNYIIPTLKGCKVEEIIVVLNKPQEYPRIVTIQRKEGKNVRK